MSSSSGFNSDFVPFFFKYGSGVRNGEERSWGASMGVMRPKLVMKSTMPVSDWASDETRASMASIDWVSIGSEF